MKGIHEDVKKSKQQNRTELDVETPNYQQHHRCSLLRYKSVILKILIASSPLNVPKAVTGQQKTNTGKF
jgi:hypothetical protein